MTEVTQEQVDAAKRLNVSLRFDDAPLTIARLIQIVEGLQFRVASLESKQKVDVRELWAKKKASWSLK
jgi:hypothetical protein